MKHLILLRTRRPDFCLLLTVIYIIPNESHQDSQCSVIAGAMLSPSAWGAVLSCGLYLQGLKTVFPWVSCSIILWKTEYAERTDKDFNKD